MPGAPDWDIYEARDRILILDLGFQCYSSYLKSRLWQGIRGRVLARANKKCRLCSRKAWQVHHEFYDIKNLNGKSLKGLWAVCGRCHRILEFTKKGRKRHPRDVLHMTRFFTFCKACRTLAPKERWDKKNDRCRSCASGKRTRKAKRASYKAERLAKFGHNKGKDGFCRRCGMSLNSDEEHGKTCGVCLAYSRRVRDFMLMRRKQMKKGKWRGS